MTSRGEPAIASRSRRGRLFNHVATATVRFQRLKDKSGLRVNAEVWNKRIKPQIQNSKACGCVRVKL